jgi:hypothetical protein
MEINRNALLSLLEAFVDASEVLQRELMLYQLLFAAASRTKGLDERETVNAVERARLETMERIKTSSQVSYQDLRAKLPQLVDLLASHQYEALKFLKEWIPKGPVN